MLLSQSRFRYIFTALIFSLKKYVQKAFFIIVIAYVQSLPYG